jgi:hypothetical protein
MPIDIVVPESRKPRLEVFVLFLCIGVTEMPGLVGSAILLK